ncbi:MAG: NUDIX hydrolase [Parachlamydiales bacterium]|nr:NUDIX hydrolase [Parachlamydiales bacterium]
MKRNLLIELLENYFPLSEEEKKYKERMLDFIIKNENCFERSLISGHITASAWLLNKNKSHSLLMHHTKLNIWVQLGGHCDGDFNPLLVSIKEASEESGLSSIVPVQKEIFDIDIHMIPENKYQKSHYHYDVRFLLKVEKDEEIQSNHESRELRWIDKDPKNLPTNSLSVIRMFNKWIMLQE